VRMTWKSTNQTEYVHYAALNAAQAEFTEQPFYE